MNEERSHAGGEVMLLPTVIEEAFTLFKLQPELYLDYLLSRNSPRSEAMVAQLIQMMDAQSKR